MRQGIHPKFTEDAKVICVCGNTFTTGSTMPEIHVDVCNKCHPFFTGKMKFVDTLGRVEKFQKKQKKAEVVKAAKVEKQEADKKKVVRPSSLKEMIDLVKKQASS